MKCVATVESAVLVPKEINRHNLLKVYSNKELIECDEEDIEVFNKFEKCF